LKRGVPSPDFGNHDKSPKIQGMPEKLWRRVSDLDTQYLKPENCVVGGGDTGCAQKVTGPGSTKKGKTAKEVLKDAENWC